MSAAGAATAPRPEARPRTAADEVYRGDPRRAPPSTTSTRRLDRIVAVCELLGDPQKAFRVVHLTGTNGKTSTTRMIERLVREHGLRTGRFTSPHLTARHASASRSTASPSAPSGSSRCGRTSRPTSQLVDQRSAETAASPRLTFFEVLTVMAFAAFADAPVDVAVIEVGMGGCWDSTNVADGEVAVITPIALDHERCLGDDLARRSPRRRPGSSRTARRSCSPSSRTSAEGVVARSPRPARSAPASSARASTSRSSSATSPSAAS